MKQALTSRLTAWLCLALVLLTGLTPAQGFVLCIEDDGCVSIEFKDADLGCAGCDGHDGASDPTPAPSSDADACPCVDLALPGSPEARRAEWRAVDIHLGAWIAPPFEFSIRRAIAMLAVSRAPAWFPPRVSDGLAHIRSVVLLV